VHFGGLQSDIIVNHVNYPSLKGGACREAPSFQQAVSDWAA